MKAHEMTGHLTRRLIFARAVAAHPCLAAQQCRGPARYGFACTKAARRPPTRPVASVFKSNSDPHGPSTARESSQHGRSGRLLIPANEQAEATFVSNRAASACKRGPRCSKRQSDVGNIGGRERVLSRALPCRPNSFGGRRGTKGCMVSAVSRNDYPIENVKKSTEEYRFRLPCELPKRALSLSAQPPETSHRKPDSPAVRVRNGGTRKLNVMIPDQGPPPPPQAAGLSPEVKRKRKNLSRLFLSPIPAAAARRCERPVFHSTNSSHPVGLPPRSGRTKRGLAPRLSARSPKRICAMGRRQDRRHALPSWRDA